MLLVGCTVGNFLRMFLGILVVSIVLREGASTTPHPTSSVTTRPKAYTTRSDDVVVQRYEKPDCHDVLANRATFGSVQAISHALDSALVQHLQPDPPSEVMWFRCVTRRPAGSTGFTPNSLQAVFSYVDPSSSHMALANRVVEELQDPSSLLVPYNLLRLYILNVLQLNISMSNKQDGLRYAQVYSKVLAQAEDDSDPIWRLLNVAFTTLRVGNRKAVSQFISVCLDGWLIAKVSGDAQPAVSNTLSRYWTAIIQLMDSDLLADVESEVADPLLWICGGIYRDRLWLDPVRLTKQLSGINSRITALTQYAAL